MSTTANVFFYGIAVVCLSIGFYITDRRYYGKTKHPHATHSLGMGLIGLTGGMGVASVFMAIS